MSNELTKPENMGTVHRSRLAELLEPGGLPRLTALTAGPGSGKTTLLMQCFGGRDAVWHTLTPADGSLSVLARNVVRKLRLIAPEISSELVTAVEGARGPDVSVDSARPTAIAAALAHDLEEAMTRDLTLVLDDVHEVGDGGDSANFLAALCRLVPRQLRLVTASRLPLPFPTSRMEVAGDLVRISAQDLAFSIDEVEELVRSRMLGEDPELAKEIYTLTGGWPVATVLAVKAGGQGTASIRREIREQTPLFDYLAEEVLAEEEPSSIELLRDVSQLPWINPELLAHLGAEMSPIFEPASVHMASAPDVPDAQVVAPLVREFLAERHPIDPAHRRHLMGKACSWYRSRGDLAEALTCARRSGDPNFIVDLVTDHGEVMVAGGHHRTVIDAIEEIPTAERTPAVLLVDAEARQLLGDWEGAIDRYRELVADEGPIPAAVAWRMGFLKHMQGKVGEALETYRRGELGSGDTRDEASLLGWRASAHWLRGQRDEAKELADGALDLARQSDDHRALAIAHTVLALVAALDGDRAANDLHYLKALEHAEKGRDVVQTIRIRSNRASAFLEEGEFDAALSELEIALRLADMTGFGLWRGMSLSNRAQVYAFRGRVEEAIADLSEARTAFRRIGSLLEAYPVALLGDVYRLRGDTAMARVAYEEAIGMAEEHEDLQALVPAYTGLARLVAPREPESAEKLASRATDIDAGIGRALALVAAGWAAHHGDNGEVARRFAEEAAHVARTRRDLPGLAESLELLAVIDPGRAEDFLEEARGIWRQLNAPIGLGRVDLVLARRTGGIEGAVGAARVAETMKRHGAVGLAREASQAERAMSHREEDRALVIKTLGGFDIVVAGQTAPRSAWQSKVAREILWMLISTRGRPLTREMLIDRLWPDDDPAKASNRLSVALSTIRRILGSDEDASHDHIVADRESVRLSLTNLVVDVEEFLEDARVGRRLFGTGDRDRGLALLRAAEERYVGEYLEEEPYADWAVSVREEARSEYLTIAELLAEAATEEGDYDGASRRYLRMLERDPFNEPAHLGLITSMRRSGRHGTARRLYGNYVTRMAELDVEPEPFPGLREGSSHS